MCAKHPQLYLPNIYLFIYSLTHSLISFYSLGLGTKPRDGVLNLQPLRLRMEFAWCGCFPSVQGALVQSPAPHNLLW